MTFTIQIRRDFAANWESVNPVLHEGEIGLEVDTDRAKMGDGSTLWNSLSYWDPSGGSAGDKNFTMTYNHLSTISVAHNLGKFPAVSVLDTAGDEIEGDITYIDFNNLTVSFSTVTSGTIVCN